MARVLIIEDEENLRRNIAAYLEDEGIDVDSVSSGEAALKRCEDGQRYDAFIVDMRLPGMDGNDTIRSLHSRFGSRNFLVHTGSAGYYIPEDLKKMGISSGQIFEKPMADLSPLVAALGEFLKAPEEDPP